MRYTKTQNIWAMTPEQIAKLQPGQWVKTSNDDHQRGIYLGTKASGSVVVAWYGNAKARDSYRGYIKTLRNYATA